jgi:tyrosyl-tRNA synthetase
MPSYGLRPQIVMTTPLLEGLDGVDKMSKSLGNYVGVTDPPNEMFGKLMSISDALMWRYYELLTDLTAAEVATLKMRVESQALHPKQAKIDLATRIVSEFHTPAAAAHATEEFERVHARRETPSDLQEYAVAFGADADRALTRVLVDVGFAASTSDAGRKIQQGGVRVGGARIADVKHRIAPTDLPALLQVSRNAVKLVVAR